METFLKNLFNYLVKYNKNKFHQIQQKSVKSRMMQKRAKDLKKSLILIEMIMAKEG